MIALHLTGCINSHCLCSIQIGFKCHFSSVWQPPIHWTTFYPFLFLFRWLHWIFRWYFCCKCWCFNHISVTFSRLPGFSLHLHFLLMNLERLQLSLWCAQTCFPCCCVAALPCAPARESFHLRQKVLSAFSHLRFTSTAGDGSFLLINSFLFFFSLPPPSRLPAQQVCYCCLSNLVCWVDDLLWETIKRHLRGERGMSL